MSKPKQLETILFIGDAHIPYEDQRAFDLMLKAGKALKPSHVVILGDFVDFYAVSSHSKDPKRGLLLKDEIDVAIKRLKQVKQLGAKQNIFVAGNHEDRMTRYLQDRAPELYDIIKIPQILQLDQLGFKYVPYKQHTKLGKLYITHDCGVSGRYAAYRMAEAFQRNVVSGHTHRLSYIVEGNAEGKRHVSATFGWLGNINEVDYMHRVKAARDWSLGFGVGYLNPKTGFVYVQPIPIVEYTCLIDGTLIQG